MSYDTLYDNIVKEKMTPLSNMTEKRLHSLAIFLGYPDKRGWKTRLSEWFGVELRVISKWIERDSIPEKQLLFARANKAPAEKWWIYDNIPPEDYKKGARIDDLPPARPDPYAETPEHMVGRRKPPPGEPVPGSYGVPELGHKVTKIYQPMTHEELIEMFKDKELAKELNELLLKIERLDPDEFRCIHGYLYGKVQTLERIKKNHNHS